EGKKEGEKEQFVDESPLVIQMHENEGDEARFGGGHGEADDKISRSRSGRAYIKRREKPQGHGDAGEDTQGNAHFGVGLLGFAIVVSRFSHGYGIVENVSSEKGIKGDT